MAFDAIADIVDLERYPLDRADGPAVAALLADGQARLGRDALYTLPGFVRPEAAAWMAAEIEQRIPWACRLEAVRTMYADDGKAYPPDHPRRRTHYSRYYQVLNHHIPNNSPLRRLYSWEPLREFLRRLMGYETFYRSECPHLALTSKVAIEGDTDNWHFDGNDVVFSVLLREPEDGGLFEYVPNLRTDEDENYEGVAAAFDGRHPGVRSARLKVGDLNVFQGNHTLHRVTPVKGAAKRIVGLFSYDHEPGTTFGEDYITTLRAQTPGVQPLAPRAA